MTIAYGQEPVCGPVSFTIQQGDRIALQGANGSGKSSILKLICGQEIPYAGEFWRGNGLKISYVGQDTSNLRGSLSDLARDSGIEESLFLAMLAKLDVPKAQMEKDMSSLSAGQKKKVLLSNHIFKSSSEVFTGYYYVLLIHKSRHFHDVTAIVWHF